LGKRPKRKEQMNNKDKAEISQLITDLYSSVAIKLDPTNSRDKEILTKLRQDINYLKSSLLVK
jgi:SOS-response transcriptional repressor LexA